MGAGGRFLWREPLDCWNSIVIGTGVDVYFHLDDGKPIVLTPSVNLAWMHSLTPGTALEVGVEGGVGIGVAGHTEDGRTPWARSRRSSPATSACGSERRYDGLTS